MIGKILRISRYLIIIAVVGAYIVAAILIVYGGVLLVNILIDIFLTTPHFSANADRKLMLECIQLIDIFLLGTAFYIVALGLYELFITRHPSTPSWLSVRDLDDLKAKILGVIIVILSVYFLEQVINWDGKRDVLDLGIGEAIMISAIVLTITFHGKHSSASITEKTTGRSGIGAGETSGEPGPAPTQGSDERG
jgi:uncharacterized protein (TIGR00645 family)